LLQVVIALHQRLHEALQGLLHQLDVVVVGAFEQVPEALASLPVPVLYHEQGHEWLFGDPRYQQVSNIGPSLEVYPEQPIDQLHAICGVGCMMEQAAGWPIDIGDV
jgi:hypothetical protein